MVVKVIIDNGISFKRNVISCEIKNEKLCLVYSDRNNEEIDLSIINKIIIDGNVIHEKKYHLLGIQLKRVIIVGFMIMVFLLLLRQLFILT